MTLHNNILNSFIILPDQLYFTNYSLECLSFSEIIYLVEDPLYFDGFCKSKIVLHRASMKYYKNILSTYFKSINSEPKDIKYISRKKFTDKHATNFSDFFSDIKTHILMFYISNTNIYDNIRYKTFNGLRIKFFETPGFLLNFRYIRMTYAGNKYHDFSSFYKKMKKTFINYKNFPNINELSPPEGLTRGKKPFPKEIEHIGNIDDMIKICNEQIPTIQSSGGE